MPEELRFEERPDDLRRPALVAAFRGWNDAGESSSMVVAHLAEQLGGRRVASIDPEGFYDFQVTRPQIDLTAPGGPELTWPEVAISVARAPEAPRDLVLVAGAEPSLRWRTFCDLVLQVASAFGVEQVVTLGSLLADVPHTHPVRLTGIAPDAEAVAHLNVREPSYSGPTGIVAVLHRAAVAAELRAVSLWAPVSHYAAGVTNPKAGLALLNAVASVTGVAVDPTRLESAAAEFEQRVSRAVESDPRLRRLVEQLEEREEQEADEPFEMPSGDELVAELERYLREREDDDR